MNIVYVTSTYPSLTETFVAREIERVIQAGNKVAICILKPFIPKSSYKAMRVKNALEIRFTYNVFLLLICLFKICITKPIAFFKCFAEATISAFRKPSRAHHILYFFIASAWFASRKELQGSEFIHCHFLHSESIATRWLSIFLDVPYGIIAHITRIRFDQRTIKRVVNNASVCIGDTNETVSLLQKYGNTNVILNRNGVDIDHITFKSPAHRLEGISPPLILAVGSFIHCKGFHVLIKACSILNELGIPFKCKIVGDGVERSVLETLIYGLNMNGEIEMTGALSMDELLLQYKEATLLVMPIIPSPSGSDGLPTVIIEAMATGLPVIGTDHAAIPDILINKETGLLVEPEEPESLALAIKEIITNEDLYYKVANRGREKVEREFDIRKNSIRLIQLIGSVIRDSM